MIWYIAIFLVVLVVFVGLKIKKHTRKLKIVLVLLLCLMIYISIMKLLSNENISLDSPRGIASAIYYSFGYLGETIGNVWEIGSDTVTTVGNVIRSEENNTKKIKFWD